MRPRQEGEEEGKGCGRGEGGEVGDEGGRTGEVGGVGVRGRVER